MSDDVVRDVLAAELALLTPLARTPEPRGYGIDLVCIDDLTDDMQETDPDSIAALAQDLYHRAIEDRGSNPDDPDAGEGIFRWLSQGMTQRDLTARAGSLAGEWRKDDRVADVQITVAAPDSKTLAITGLVTPQDPAFGPFKLIIAVTDGAAHLQILLTA